MLYQVFYYNSTSTTGERTSREGQRNAFKRRRIFLGIDHDVLLICILYQGVVPHVIGYSRWCEISGMHVCYRHGIRRSTLLYLCLDAVYISGQVVQPKTSLHDVRDEVCYIRGEGGKAWNYFCLFQCTGAKHKNTWRLQYSSSYVCFGMLTRVPSDGLQYPITQRREISSLMPKID